MKTILALSAVLASALAAAQAPAPSEPAKKPKAPLNLKLDDAPRANSPRINFDGRDDKAAKNNLPGLGEGARSMERQPTRSSESSSPFPKDTNPGMR